MMLNKKSDSAGWLKLLALVPIVGVTLALQAETVNDYVYDEPQKQVVKKGRKNGQVKIGNQTIKVEADKGVIATDNIKLDFNGERDPQKDPLVVINGKRVSYEEVKALDQKTIDHITVLKEKAAMEIYGKDGKNGVIEITTKTAKKPLVLRLIQDKYNRILGVTSESEPPANCHFSKTEYPVGNIFIEDRVATAEEVANINSLNLELFESIHNPNSAGDPKWNYKDKEGILVFRTKKPQNAEPEKTAAKVVSADVPEPDNAFDVVEEMPQYPGGVGELMKFLSMNIKYPEAAEKAGTEGRVIATFIVERDGTITNAEVIKSVSPELDGEALRVLGAMPKWNPGKQKGRTVRVKYTIPISFRLDKKEKEAQEQPAEKQ